MRWVFLIALVWCLFGLRAGECVRKLTERKVMLRQSSSFLQRRDRLPSETADGSSFQNRKNVKCRLLSESGDNVASLKKGVLCFPHSARISQEDGHFVFPFCGIHFPVLPFVKRESSTAKYIAQHAGACTPKHEESIHEFSRDRLWLRRANGQPDGGFHIGINHANSRVKRVPTRYSTRAVMRRTSLLEVLDEALPDKQANAVRRQGIDSSMLRYAGLILSQDTQTGVVYSVALPPSLQGIRAQAVRVVQDSFKQAGFILNEFTFPANAVLSPESEYVMLVYRETSSFTIYTLPPDYQFGGPVVGIVMSSSNSTSIDPSVPPATISLPADSYINVSLPTFSTISGSNALCAFFSSNGSVFTSNIASQPNFCLSSTLGDFAIIIKGHPGSSPMQDASPSTPSTDGNLRSSPSKKNSSTNWRLIVGAIFLTFAGLVFLVAVAFLSIKLTESARILLKTRYNGNDEALQDSLVGGGHAPSAPIIRTKPALEIDVARFSHHLDV